MHTNQEISESLVENDEKFNDEFFQRFNLKLSENPLQLTDDIAKHYRFPTFYADASCSMAIFHCDYEAAKALMPDSSMEPVKMTKGRALVIFSCYEYRNVLNVAPYNEIAMTIPVITDGGMNIPVLSMLLGDKQQKFGYYVFHMPVTSLENLLRGRKIWGLPKDVERIDISHNEQYSNTAAYDGGDEPYIQLQIPMKGASQSFDAKSNLYSVLGGDRLTSVTQFKGLFNVTKNMGAVFKKAASENTATIKLGSGPMADKLKALKIEGEAFQFRYCPSINACFDLAHDKVATRGK